MGDVFESTSVSRLSGFPSRKRRLPPPTAYECAGRVKDGGFDAEAAAPYRKHRGDHGRVGPHQQALVTNLEGVELTTMLELAVRRLVSSAIVFEYTFIDELLGTIIGVYFEGARGGRQAWQTKRFQRFNAIRR